MHFYLFYTFYTVTPSPSNYQKKEYGAWLSNPTAAIAPDLASKAQSSMLHS